MQLKIGQEVDGYRIEKVLGSGGMGIVYKAIDIALARPVALKVIQQSLTEDVRFAHRFQSEARLLAQVNSPNIVGVHAFRQTEHGVFIVMEYVDGRDLSEILKDGPMPPDRVVEIVRQTLMALDKAHSAGVVHRDIKPHNVMITGSDSVKVTDFGLAKMKGPDMMSTMTQGIIGTLFYMSPEQVRGEPADFRSDLWAVGVMLYEMLVGERPFDAGQEAAVLYSIMNLAVQIPPAALKKMPVGLDRVILKALEKNADDRYQSASDMLADIESCLSEAEPSVAAVTVPGAPSFSAKKLAGVSLGILAAASVLFGIWTLIGSDVSNGIANGPSTASTLPTIRTQPDGATGQVNGRELGQTPLAQATNGSGFVDGETGEQLGNEPPSSPPRQTSTSVTLNLEVHPEGTVSIDDGAVRQPGPITVDEGWHTIKCQSSTYGEIERRIEIVPGETLTSTCYFEGKVNVVHLGSDWGSVWIDGVNQNRQTPAELEMGPGTYLIEVRRFGYDVSGPTDSTVVAPSFDRQEVHMLIFELSKQ